MFIGTCNGQSDFCSTATPITLTNGTACVNGTTIGATSDLFLYGACNIVSVNEVWYTYTASGANNNLTVNSLGLTNCEIVVYSGGCPGGTGALEICNAQTGATAVSASWGFAPGTQIWVGVMSNAGIEGSFQLCINSFAPAPVGGNICSTAIPICAIGSTTSVNMATMSSSGTYPSCFWAAVNQDVWFTFTCTVSGTIEWTANTPNANELDWAMYNSTLSCPGVLVACNYSYDFANGSPVGMNDAITCVACPTDLAVGACGEYCSEYFVTAGQTYSIMIDVFSGVIGNLDFGFTAGTTAQIAPVSAFTVSPSVICGPDMTVTITNNSVGNPPNWTFGNGNSSTGSNPAPEYYNVPGTYAITATITDPQCPSTHTEFIQLVAPVSGTTISVNETCPSSCNGSSIANTITGGNGVYSYVWVDNLLNPIGQNTLSATGLCAGNYALQITSSTCPLASFPVTITTLNALDDPTYTLTPNCNIEITAAVTGTPGGTFSFSTPPGDGASIDPNTGLVTGGTQGWAYNILYTTSGACPSSSVLPVSNLTVDDPAFTMTATCDGGISVISGTSGGVFSFNTVPIDGAQIDPATGVISGGTSGTTYDVLYTTNGICSQNSTQQVTAISQDDPTFAMTSTCDGAIANISGLGGGTFTFTNPPADAAIIDPVIGEITGGSPGGSYYVTYTTNGVCVSSLDLTVFTLLPDDASFTMSPTCDGGTASLLLGSPGGVFAFDVTPLDGAQIDLNSGLVSGGTPGSTYNVIYTTSGACSASSVESVIAFSLPLAPLAGTDVTYCSSDLYASMTASGGGGTFNWYSDAGLTNVLGTNSQIQPNDINGTTIYYVTETMNGCEGPASSVAITIEDCDIIIPTAFTPGSDLVNNVWEIVNLDNVYPNNVVWVYNRWGSVLFTSNPGTYNYAPWDGTYKGELLPVGSYYFIIEFKDKKNENAKGTVTLILNK